MGYWSTCESELVFTREGRRALTRAMLAVAMLGDAEPPIDDLDDEVAQQSRRQFHAALRYYMPRALSRAAAGEDEGGGAGEEGGEEGEEARRLCMVEQYLWTEEGAEHELAGAEQLGLRMLEREGKNYSAGQFLGGCFERGWLDLERTAETIRFVGEDDEMWGYRLGETPVVGGGVHAALLLYVDFEKCLPREPGESSDDEYDPESDAHNAEGRGVCSNCDFSVARAPQWSDAGLCQACEWEECCDLDDMTEGESHVEWQWAPVAAAAEAVAVPAAEAPLLAAGGGDGSGGGGGGGSAGGAAPPAAPAAAPSAPPPGAAAATTGGGGGSSSSSSSSSSSDDDDDGDEEGKATRAVDLGPAEAAEG